MKRFATIITSTDFTSHIAIFKVVKKKNSHKQSDIQDKVQTKDKGQLACKGEGKEFVYFFYWQTVIFFVDPINWIDFLKLIKPENNILISLCLCKERIKI